MKKLATREYGVEQIRLHLQRGFQCHNNGMLKQAKLSYLRVLQIQPDNVNACQLLATIYAQEKDFVKAIPLFERALRITTDAVNVRNNLAYCYNNTYQFNETLSCLEHWYRENIQSACYYFKALIHLGNYSAVKERFPKGLVQKHPKQSVVLQLQLVEAYQLSNEIEEAIRLLNEILLIDPANDSVKLRLACNYRLQNRPDLSKSLIESLLSKRQVSFEVYHNYGNTLCDLGLLEEAEHAYLNALKMNDQYIHTHVNLANVRWEMGEKDRFLQSFEGAMLSGEKKNAELVVSYIDKLSKSKQTQHALHIIDLHWDDIMHLDAAWVLRSRALREVGENEMAMKLAKFKTSPSEEFLLEQSIVDIQLGHYEQAQKRIFKILKNDPANRLAMAYNYVCMRLLKPMAEELYLIHTHLIKSFKLPVPMGYDSIADFCNEFAAYLSSLHTSTSQPLEQSIESGTQSRGNLFGRPHRLVRLLEESIMKCVVEYNNAFKSLGKTPFGFTPASSMKFATSWSVKLNSRGYHRNHVHPMGWLSSACYIALPNEIGDSSFNGYLEFGLPDCVLPTALKPAKLLKPEVGTLVLFPSFIWHGTRPFDSVQSRLTVSCDIESEPNK